MDAGGYVRSGAMTVGDGRVFAVGQTDGAFPRRQNAGGYDAFLAAYDTATGAPAWVRQFGSCNECGCDVDVDPTGIFVVGLTDGSLPRFENRGNYDAFIRVFDLTSRRQWTQQFGTRQSDAAWGIAADGGGITVTGVTDGNLGTGHVGDSAVFVRRHDSP